MQLSLIKLKNTVISVLTILCLALVLNSCMVKDMLLGDPEPAVLEEEQLPHKVAIFPFVKQTSNPEASTDMQLFAKLGIHPEPFHASGEEPQLRIPHKESAAFYDAAALN